MTAALRVVLCACLALGCVPGEGAKATLDAYAMHCNSEASMREMEIAIAIGDRPGELEILERGDCRMVPEQLVGEIVRWVDSDRVVVRLAGAEWWLSNGLRNGVP